MCTTIRLKSGHEICSVEQFEEYFKINADELMYEGDDFIERECCLCQIDLDNFMKNKQSNFEYENGDWWEK